MMKSRIQTVSYQDSVLRLVDQRKIPIVFEYYDCMNYRDVIFAIKEMVVRGAPAIGNAAAYGVVLASKEYFTLDEQSYLRQMQVACDELEASRPTAVNLRWAIDRMRTIILSGVGKKAVAEDLRSMADLILKEDIDISLKISQHGNAIVPHGARILTHCNTGALAVSGFGTALGVIRQAHYSGKDILVYADETRPRLQGGRLTAWELMQEEIPVTLVVDSVAATLIRDHQVDLVIVGADRIANNGDTANKIGTFMLSVLSKTYDVPFYVAAPISTIDFHTSSGKDIIIEERDAKEVTHIEGIRMAPEGVHVYNPAFDVTPWENIAGIITEKGILRPPFHESIMKWKDN